MESNSDNYAYEQLKERVVGLLDCVERPVGTLKPRIPQTPESERCILALFEQIERTL